MTLLLLVVELAGPDRPGGRFRESQATMMCSTDNLFVDVDRRPRISLPMQLKIMSLSSSAYRAQTSFIDHPRLTCAELPPWRAL